MDNSRKSIPSSSTNDIFEENHENANPSLLPPQHPTDMTTPPSFYVPNTMHTPTFSAPMTHEGAGYSFNPDGYIVRNTEGLNDMIQPSTEKSFILEIPSGFDVITCVKQFAQRYQLAVNVLCGDGLISEVDFMFPRSQVTPRTISGCYQIILISGTYGCLNAASPNTISDFTVELVDAQGTSVGGLVASTMKVASTVTLVISATSVLSQNV